MSEHFQQTLTRFVERRDGKALNDLARASAGENAIQAALAAIAARAWEADYWGFGDAVWTAMDQPPDGFRRMVDAFSAMPEVPEAAAKSLKGVFLFATEHSTDREARVALVSWFVRCAGPNQAEIVTDWLTGRWPSVRRGEAISSDFEPLLDWVFENASGTLQGIMQGTALRSFLALVHRHRPERLPLAMRLLLTSASLGHAVHVDGFLPHELNPHLEKALELGADPAWLHEALTASADFCDALEVYRLLDHQRRRSPDPGKLHLERYPRLHAAVLDWITQGERDRRSALLEHLRGAWTPDDPAFRDPQHWKLDYYAAEAANAFAAAYAEGAIEADLAETVLRLAERVDTSKTIALALTLLDRSLFAANGIDHDEIRDLIGLAHPNGVSAAVRLLIPTSTVMAATLSPHQRSTLVQLFEDLLYAAHRADAAPIVREAVGVQRRARLTSTCSDPNFVVMETEDGWVVGSDSVYAKLLADHPGERGLMLSALYFAHEVVHHAQGLADKRDVVNLRRGGSELMVMRLDLSADMLAIDWVAMLNRPGWTRGALHDATIRGFESFPASMSHTQASVTRKSIRIACHIFTMLQARSDFGWAWLELPPLGGTATLWWSHPVDRRVASFPVTADDVRSLSQLAYGPEYVGEIEKTVDRCRVLLSAR